MTLIRQFADAMSYVGQGVDARFEREQVEWVFGLTGGELSDEPLKFQARSAYSYGEEYGEWEDRSWHYHYDGVPEWATEDFDRDIRHSAGTFGNVQHFTLVEIGCSYGSGAPQTIRFADGSIWHRVAQYAHSGETECPMGSCGDDETVGEDSTEGMHRCPLCEEEKGEKHGYIYVGDGCETVYAQIDFECAECGVLKSELTADDPACNCEEDA